MKKIFLALMGLLCVTMIMLETDLVAFPKVSEFLRQKTECSGYTIIDAGKAVTCTGDTVRLTKKFGYYEVISEPDRTVTSTLLQK